jgi:hypothetical protein
MGSHRRRKEERAFPVRDFLSLVLVEVVMTRDEAIKIQRRHGPTQLIDILADLGVLKLDEPKSTDELFKDAMTRHGFYISVADQVLGALKAAGLKIVDK